MNSRQPVSRKALGIKLGGALGVRKQRARAVRPDALFHHTQRCIQPDCPAGRIHNGSIRGIDIGTAAQGNDGLGRLRDPLQVFALELAEMRLAEARKDLADGEAFGFLDFGVEIEKSPAQFEREFASDGALPRPHKTYKIDALDGH